MLNFEFQSSGSAHTGSMERKLFQKGTTHLARIAVVLQEAPYKMMTFSQLMAKLAPLIPEDPKSMECNIRVCLSSYKCFVKIPMVPGSHDSKRNYWKLDTNQITEKMVRRHFKGILELFPELASKVRMEPMSRAPMQGSSVASSAVPLVKFRGPFSSESILKPDGEFPEMPSAHRVSRPVLREQQPQPGPSHRGHIMGFGWEPEERLVPASSSGLALMYPAGDGTPHGLTTARAEGPIRQMHEVPQGPFPVYTRASTGPCFPGPCFPGPYCSCKAYPEPKYSQDAQCLWF